MPNAHGGIPRFGTPILPSIGMLVLPRFRVSGEGRWTPGTPLRARAVVATYGTPPEKALQPTGQSAFPSSSVASEHRSVAASATACGAPAAERSIRQAAGRTWRLCEA
jgi:hypothetical protein